jgi:hypothetical protein
MLRGLVRKARHFLAAQRARTAALIGCAVVLIGEGCTELMRPLPPNSERFDAPPVYSEWWRMIEECSGITGSLSSVSWYVVPGTRFISLPPYGEVGAYTEYTENRIVLSGESQMVGQIVRHEMLHELTRVSGHPRNYFFEKCGGLVECADACAEEAGPPPVPPQGTPLVSGDSFEVTVSIHPSVPSSDTLGGYFQVVVSARNDANHSVVLEGPPPPDPLPASTFGYIFGASGPGLGFVDTAWDSEVTWFQAGETKREVFDFVVGNRPGARQIEPGTYQLRGSFGVHLTAPITFTVSP